ncbi:MAG: LytTR family DNA-binding domain-containing protein [Saprospiraceae bacterium]
MTLHTIVVDDESMARKLLVENIKQIPFLKLVGTCKNAFEAMALLQEESVDLMFLDIQMPGMIGTKLLESLKEKPLVIFVTAYSNYAVESYDLEVVDYLMKPVSLERFTKAAYRALHLKQSSQGTGPMPSAPAPPIEDDKQDSFFVNVEYALVKIQANEITHIEGMKDYVKIFISSNAKPILTKSTLKAIEEKLPNKGFMRVHKSFIVNLEKIRSIRNHQITIEKYEIPVSESNMDTLLKQIGYSK